MYVYTHTVHAYLGTCTITSHLHERQKSRHITVRFSYIGKVGKVVDSLPPFR